MRGALLGVAGVDRVDRVVVVNEPSRPQRQGLVATIFQAVRGDYTRAARILDRMDLDVILLQHEYGIFGGADGEYVLSLAEEVTQPLVVTLHTVLSEPTAHQAEVLSDLCGQAERVVVMTETARRLLIESGGCTADKVRIVPHGAPVILSERAAESLEAWSSHDPGSVRGRFGDGGGRFVLSTFGLLSSGKGIETVIEALPPIVERHPEVLYVIAGRTHPGVAHREGERYRASLEQAVRDLGLEEHVEFDDRFLALGEIADLLAATDVFVTPYKGREQVASGVLTYALAAGCAVVSTPYWYAEDMLASGAGELVPFADPAALAEAVCRFIDDPETAVGGAGCGTDDRLETGVAVGRGGDRGRAGRGRPPGDAASSCGCAPRASDRASANRSSADARRRRRDRAARKRRDSEPSEWLLRG